MYQFLGRICSAVRLRVDALIILRINGYVDV